MLELTLRHSNLSISVNHYQSFNLQINHNFFFYIISILNVSGINGDAINPANIPDTLHKISTISNTPRIKTNCSVSNNTTNIIDMIKTLFLELFLLNTKPIGIKNRKLNIF